MARRFDLSKRFVNTGLSQLIGALLEGAGLHVTRSMNTLREKRLEVLQGLEIPVVLDVGANIGQYAMELRNSKYNGRIISFEPDPRSYSELAVIETLQQGHVCLQMGLGSANGEAQFLVRKNSTCSSFRSPARNNGLETDLYDVESSVAVPVQTLDSVLPEISRKDERFYLKIDTQGFEREVLLGAGNTLKRTDAVEVELSLTALYEGQALLPEIWGMLAEAGFRPAWIERGYRDPGDIWLVQVDGLFVREDAWRSRGKIGASDRHLVSSARQ